VPCDSLQYAKIRIFHGRSLWQRRLSSTTNTTVPAAMRAALAGPCGEAAGVTDIYHSISCVTKRAPAHWRVSASEMGRLANGWSDLAVRHRGDEDSAAARLSAPPRLFDE
jgi:hypothetical protein